MSSLEARQLELRQPPAHGPIFSAVASVAMQSHHLGQGEAKEHRAARQATNDWEFPLTELVAITVAAFRHHPHICNVMTHISGDRWEKVGEALHAILDPHARRDDLPPLAENIIDLLCAEGGVTGRILEPYFRDLLDQILPAHLALRLNTHVGCLSSELEAHRAQACRRRSSGRPLLREGSR